MTRAVLPKECPKGQGPMRRGFLLNGNADLKWRMPLFAEGSEAFTQPARASKQIDDSKGLGQGTSLIIFLRILYRWFGSKNQACRGRQGRHPDPISNDGKHQGEGHAA